MGFGWVVFVDFRDARRALNHYNNEFAQGRGTLYVNEHKQKESEEQIDEDNLARVAGFLTTYDEPYRGRGRGRRVRGRGGW